MARMERPPDFDPFELLGVDASADPATIDRAYKARIRFVHPDVAGEAGLDETKRLNVAREWLLDPELRALLPPPTRSWRRQWTNEPPPPPSPPPPTPRSERGEERWEGRWEDRPRRRPVGMYDPLEDDPLTFDYGSATDTLRAFFEAVTSLSTDERARVTHSLGDEPPVFFDQFRGRLDGVLWERSRALDDAVERVWRERQEEDAPLLFPRGRIFGDGAVVANAYAQWLLLGDALRDVLDDPDRAALLASRCMWPWQASLGHVRYGSHQREVVAFLEDARRLSLSQAERLARAWHKHMGSYLYGRPGEDWFPGALDQPKPALVSARLAAVDASRVEPPAGLDFEHHNGFRFGLRLTAHVLALGGVNQPGRDYLLPWRDALDPSPSFMDRARWGMPLG